MNVYGPTKAALLCFDVSFTVRHHAKFAFSSLHEPNFLSYCTVLLLCAQCEKDPFDVAAY